MIVGTVDLCYDQSPNSQKNKKKIKKEAVRVFVM